MSISKQLGEQRELTLAQGTIRYRERGDGDPVVFVHGLLVNGDLWRNVVPPLAGGFRCITPDWPLGSHELPMDAGADLSPPGLAKLIADFMTALELENVTLVGNDTGGALSQLVATRHPERLGRLVLASCDAYEVFPPSLFRPLQWSARLPGAVFGISQLLRLGAFRRLPIAYGWTAKRMPERAVMRSYVGPVARTGGVRRDTVRFIKAISPEHTLAAARRFARFDRPVLVAWGAEDRFFPIELAQRLATAFPDARLELIPDSRTFIPEDQPERLSALIRSFMRQPVPTTT